MSRVDLRQLSKWSTIELHGAATIFSGVLCKISTKFAATSEDWERFLTVLLGATCWLKMVMLKKTQELSETAKSITEDTQVNRP